MDKQPLGPIAVFAVVFFVLTLFAGAGFFGAIFSTLVACAVFYGVSRYLVARRADKPPH